MMILVHEVSWIVMMCPDEISQYFLPSEVLTMASNAIPGTDVATPVM